MVDECLRFLVGYVFRLEKRLFWRRGGRARSCNGTLGNRVMHTRVQSDQAQRIWVECGCDEGVKVKMMGG